MAIDSFLAQGGMLNPFGNATGAVGETGDMLAAGAADAKKYLNWTIEHKDGKQKAVYDMDMETSKEFQSQLKQLDAIKTSYNDEVNRISQKEAQTRAHPIASILANVASAFAQNPKNPGWVQSLGKFAAAENPTADALMREKMQVQGGIAGLLKEQAGITGAMVGEQREQRLTQMATAKATLGEKQIDERKRQTLVLLQRDLASKAAEGKYPGDSAQMLELYGADRELAHSMDQYLQGVNQKAIELQKAKQVAVTEKQKTDIQGKIDLQKNKQSGDMQKLVKSHENALDLQNKKISQTTTKLGAAGGVKPLPEVTRKQMASLDSASHALDEVEKILNKDSASLGIVGGLSGGGRIREMTDADFAGDVNTIRIQVANAIKATGAGARGFGPQERGFFQSISENPFSKTVQQNLGVVKAWRSFIQRELSSIMTSHPEIKDWGEYTKILHPDAKDAAPAKPSSGKVIHTQYGDVTVQE